MQNRSLFLCLLITGGLLASAAQAEQYWATEIGRVNPAGYSYVIPYGINDRGQVWGGENCYDGTEEQQFLWEGGNLTYLNPPGAQDRILVYQINNVGQGAGWAFGHGPDGSYRKGPAIWENGRIRYLPAPGEVEAYRGAADINDLGDAVGFTYTWPVGEAGTGLYWHDGTLTELGSLGGGTTCAEHINNRRQIAGMSTTAADEEHAFFWDNGVMTDLGTLGGERTSVRGINDRGQVVGVSWNSDERERAFLWENGVLMDLGTLPDDIESRASGINEAGQIVGTSRNGPNVRMFLWENGVMSDLGRRIVNAENWDQVEITGINSQGWIVGCWDRDGRMRAFVLTPVPDPSGFAPLAFACAGVLSRLRCGRTGRKSRDIETL